MHFPRKILDNMLGTGKPSDWNVPTWNRPAAGEFLRAEAAVQQALARLTEIEAQIDVSEYSGVREELGEGYEPTDARRANARFESSHWQQAWHEFLIAVEHARKCETQWREETTTKK